MAKQPTRSGKGALGTGTLDAALRVIDFLASREQPQSLAQIAKAFAASKSTIYRHLVTLQRHGYVRQDPETSRYEPGINLVILGEAVRRRFQIATAARDELSGLRERTGQAVTICGLVDGKLVVLDLLHGRMIIEFNTRPGTQMALHATAHGKIWLAFGDTSLLEEVVASPLENWTPRTIVEPARLREEIDNVRANGWATAPDELIIAVNALAAPIFNHRNEIEGSVAIVGSTQFVPAVPATVQIEEVLATARRISQRIGWREGQ